MHNASAPSVYTQVMKRMDDSKSISAYSKNTRGQFSMHNSFRVGWGAGRLFALPARVDRDVKTSVAIRSVHRKEQNGTDRFPSLPLCTHTACRTDHTQYCIHLPLRNTLTSTTYAGNARLRGHCWRYHTQTHMHE